MENLFRTVGTLCARAYVIGLFMSLTGSKSSEKSIKLAAALYMVSVLLNPSNKFSFDFDYDYNYNRRVSAMSAEDYVIETAGENISRQIKNILNEKNISYTDVSVHINKQTDKVYIESIVITGVSDEQRERVVAEISQATGEECLIWR